MTIFVLSVAAGQSSRFVAAGRFCPLVGSFSCSADPDGRPKEISVYSCTHTNTFIRPDNTTRHFTETTKDNN